MENHAGHGNRGMIGITYQRCREALERDLGVEVSPETTRLFEQLQHSQLQPLARPTPAAVEPGQPPVFFLADEIPQHVERPLVITPGARWWRGLTRPFSG